MRLGILFSGGKDSTYATYIAKEKGYDITCLISINSKNKYSYMFHTPSINQTIKQAEAMDLPIIIKETEGEKETELDELREAIKEAIDRYQIKGIVTGAVESVYQGTRVQKICNELNIHCFNPLWQKNQIELLNDLIKNQFEVIITGVAAYPLDQIWLGKRIDQRFIEDVKELNQKFHINPAGEGGEFESLVLNCPLFRYPLKIKNKTIHSSEGNHILEVRL